MTELQLNRINDRRVVALEKWEDYTEAKEAMFFYTDTADAPWTIIKSSDKKRARINCTMPGPDGRWRWYGRQFLLPNNQ